MRIDRPNRSVVVCAIIFAALVLLAVVVFVVTCAGSGRVVVKMTGLEAGKEVASPAIAYVESHDDFPPEQVSDYFEISPEGYTMVNASGEQLRLVVVQPPVYADGSVYGKDDASSSGYSVVLPAQGFLFFKPLWTTFEVDLSGCEAYVPTVERVSSLIEDEIQQNQNALEDTRLQQSATVAAALTDNEADAAYHEYEVWKYENQCKSYEDKISQYDDLLARVNELDNSDIDGLIAAYKEWCVLCYRDV